MSNNSLNVARRLSSKGEDNLARENYANEKKPLTEGDCDNLRRKFHLVPEECKKFTQPSLQSELDKIGRSMAGMDPGEIAKAKEAHIAGKKFEGGAKLQRRYTGGIAR